MQNDMSKTTKAPKFTVFDTFNGVARSTHRTLEAAVKAERRFGRAVKRSNGASSYIPTTILCDGHGLTPEQLEQVTDARIALDHGN